MHELETSRAAETLATQSPRRLLTEERLRISLSILTDVERQAMSVRFGLGEGHFNKSLRKAAAEIGCSPSTVWERTERALRKLRDVTHS